MVDRPEMTKSETVDMMRRCASEIRQLRQQVAALQPKAEAYDSINSVLGLLPRAPQGYSEDLAWTLDKRIREMEAKTEEKANG